MIIDFNMSETISGDEQVYIQKTTWLKSRQNVVVALLYSSILGAITVMRLEAVISILLFPTFVVLIMFEFWAVINYEKTIVQYQLRLEKIRKLWDIPRNTMT